LEGGKGKKKVEKVRFCHEPRKSVPLGGVARGGRMIRSSRCRAGKPNLKKDDRPGRWGEKARAWFFDNKGRLGHGESE